MACWLIKSEPSTYSWRQLVKDRRTRWDGVRNFQARNSLAAMRKGEICLFYHSGAEPAIVGVARVVKEAYPDPTADDPRWVAVDVAPEQELASPVPLAGLKADRRTRGMAMLKQGRLSVSPVTDAELEAVLAMGGA